MTRPQYSILAAILFILFAGPAQAACINPAGSAGDQMYNSTYNVMQYCNGTDWMAMGATNVWTLNGGDTYFNAGNVGIGMTAPIFGLDVEKVTGATNAKFGATLPTYLTSNNPMLGFNSYYNSGWKFGKGSTTQYGGRLAFDAATGALNYGVSTAGGAADAAATMTDRLTILQNGNVGIGTAAPLSQLHVVKQSLSVPSAALQNTTSVVVEGSDGGIELFGDDNSGTWTSWLSLGSLSTGALVDKWTIARQTANAGNSSLNFNYGAGASGATNPSLVTILTSGNVGIGTTGPAEKLEVTGNIKATGTISDVSGVISGVPPGFVGHFDLASCPAGWSEMTAARGRYVVGKPSGGTLSATVGTPLTNTENRPTGQHNHGSSGLTFSGNAMSAHGHGIGDPGHGHSMVHQNNATSSFGAGGSSSWDGGVASGGKAAQAASPNFTGISISGASAGTPSGSIIGNTANSSGTSGVAGTNAPYIQLLVCKKN